MDYDKDEIDPITAEYNRQQGKKWFLAFGPVLAVTLAAIFGWVFTAYADVVGFAPMVLGGI